MYQDGTYLGNNPTWHLEDAYWKADAIAKVIRKNNITPAVIGDIGCGAGEILLRVTRTLNTQGRGFDVSADAYALAQERAGNGVSFVHGNLLDTDEHFDLLLAIDVFEHVDDYLGFLRSLRKHAEYFVFHIPLDLSAQAILRGTPLMQLRRSVGHLHYFSKDTALATLKDAGFTIVDWTYTEVPPKARQHRTLSNRLMYLPRSIASKINPDFAARVLGGRSVLALCR